jgi:uncharacterized spore protein YtfJ
MGRKAKNTIKKLVSMHPSLVEEIRGYAKKRTDQELKKESKLKTKQDGI